MRYPPYIEEAFTFPEFFRVKMHYPHSRVSDITKALHRSLDEVLNNNEICPGDSVAVGIGSRGIDNLPVMVKALCQKLNQIGAKPVIIPAMGSHGGATGEGQKRILMTMGITEELCGCTVQSSLEVKKIGSVFGEVPVYFSSDALKMNHSICINRIKQHTKFKASVESGIYKMLCIGMGKHQGALVFHNWALKYGFYPLLEAMGNEIIKKSNFRFGIGVVENAYDETMKIAAIPRDKILDKEKELMELSRRHFPRLPVKQIDVLVVWRIGKEISGVGMDPNVTGRTFDLKEDDFSGVLNATRLAILNLSEKSNGNGMGMGNADFITEKVYKNLDYETTVMNAMTGISLRKAFIPIRMPDDRKAIQGCFTTIGPVASKTTRAIIIRETLHVTEFWASEALLHEIQAVPEAKIMEKVRLDFDGAGNLVLPGLH